MPLTLTILVSGGEQVGGEQVCQVDALFYKTKMLAVAFLGKGRLALILVAQERCTT